MREREAFFYENAGYSWDPKTQTENEGRRECARSLAEAEAWGERLGLEVQWDYDDYAGDTFGQEEAGPFYCAWVVDDAGAVVASLAGIDGDPCPRGGGILTPYARCVEAELLAEARSVMLNGPSVEPVL